MKVSIVTISFNQAEYLERALTSVLNQGYDDLEYIVVDAGSTDGSHDIIERYRDRIDRVIMEPDRGPADGLNKGFALASGELFGYINSDDVLLDQAVEKAVAAFERTPSADVVYGHGYIVDEAERPIRRFRSNRFHRWRFVHGAVVVMQQATFFRSTAFKRVGGFNTSRKAHWDGEFLLDLSLAGARFHRVEDYWGLFRIHEASITARHWQGSTSLVKEIRDRNAELRERVTGQPPRPSDDLRVVAARVAKWVVEPVGLYWRIVDKLRPPKIPTPRSSTRDRSV